MNTIKAIIVDDSASAAKDLTKKLQKISSIELKATAQSFEEAIKQIKKNIPDVLFLDIEMPEKNGFDLLYWLKNNLEKTPYIIFVTGHDKFVLKALKEGALDYILKPADEIELHNAVDKALAAFEKDEQLQKLDYILNYISGGKQLFLPSNTGYRSVNAADIVYFWRNAQTKRIEIVFGENDKLILPINYTLAHLLEQLPPSDFFQIKRELIINTRYLKELAIYNKDCILKKGNFEVRVQMSRRSLKEFREKMGL
ncbi:LytR/AlgR family response regulator transcription factor [Maribellus maritimus]|uniref:LytR/AlgR family response regulator transcription factor n=1 Tax=Maribellus maritimus TaxID=2870838 RepID=UPI001EEC5349|nr:LytTR family DNA-binding domain-containing protein [Maribellus maritimus]MCG6191140.1 LytTR family DNA-binding domain-containing protein [Maribellus maritimus]